MFFWTETPNIEMWNQIRYLRSPKNVENLLSGKIKSKRENINFNPDDIHERAYEISSCIKQANEYYVGAENVGIVTQPLLQFYGAQSLSKAVILANNPNIRLSDLKYHGLSTRASTASEVNLRQTLQDYSNNSSEWKIEKEYAITNDGVFPHLCKSIGEITPDKGTVLNFKELIRILPDLSDKYTLHYNEPSYCCYTISSPSLHNKNEVFFSEFVDIDNVIKVFPELTDSANYKETILNGRYKGFIYLHDNESFPIGKIEKGTIAADYLVRPLKCGIHKSFSTILVTLFILSNLVRYKPSFWMKEIEGSVSGSISIVEDFCNLAKRRLPNDALESIWHEKFIFSTSSHLI